MAKKALDANESTNHDYIAAFITVVLCSQIILLVIMKIVRVK